MVGRPRDSTTSCATSAPGSACSRSGSATRSAPRSSRRRVAREVVAPAAFDRAAADEPLTAERRERRRAVEPAPRAGVRADRATTRRSRARAAPGRSPAARHAKSLAEVDGRPGRRPRRARRAAGRRRPGRRRPRRSARRAASAARATGAAGEPTIASSRCGARCWSSATSIQPNADGARDERVADEARAPRRRAARARRRPRCARGAGARRRASRCRSASDGRRAPSCARRAARRRRASGRSRRRLVVGEELDREQREAVRLAQPARVAGRDVQLDQAVGDVGVVLEVAGSLRDAVAPRAVQAAVRRRERPEQELARARRPASTPAGLRERGQHQPVPRRDRLVVARAASAAARAASNSRARVASSSSPRSTKRPSSNGCSSSSGAPSPGAQRERQPLDAVGVGVLRRGEAAAVERELAQHVVDRRVGDLRGSALAEARARRAGRRDASSALS